MSQIWKVWEEKEGPKKIYNEDICNKSLTIKGTKNKEVKVSGQATAGPWLFEIISRI